MVDRSDASEIVVDLLFIGAVVGAAISSMTSAVVPAGDVTGVAVDGSDFSIVSLEAAGTEDVG